MTFPVAFGILYIAAGHRKETRFPCCPVPIGQQRATILRRFPDSRRSASPKAPVNTNRAPAQVRYAPFASHANERAVWRANRPKRCSVVSLIAMSFAPESILPRRPRRQTPPPLARCYNFTINWMLCQIKYNACHDVSRLRQASFFFPYKSCVLIPESFMNFASFVTLSMRSA